MAKQPEYTETPNTGEFKVDPVAWSKRGNKIAFGNVAELKVDSELVNIRFKAGTEVFGVKVDADTYDLASLRPGVIEGGGIREPIWVSVRDNGDKVTIRGNRRTLVGQELLEDGSISAELRKSLSEGTPMLLFHGLTPAQERELVFDQDQKRFLRSEITRQLFNLRKQGKGYETIVLQYWNTIGEKFIKPQKVAEIKAISDPQLKIAKIKSSYRGSVDCYLLWGYDLGAYMQKQIMLSEMRLDGLLKEDGEQPYFYTTKGSQERIAELRAAKKADGEKFNGSMLIEGSEFKKVCDKFHQEDYGIVVKTKPAGKKTLTRDEINSLKETSQSRAVRSALERVLGEDATDMQVRDEAACILEAKVMLVEIHLPHLTPEVAACVKACLVNVNPTDFNNYLQANYKPATPPETPPTA